MINEAYILAGGKSSRMGEDKGLKKLYEKTLIEHIINILIPNFNFIKINTENQEYTKFGYELIPDLIKSKGPMGGIYSILKNTNEKSVFIVCCDMPAITSKVIQYLLKNINHKKVTIAAFNGKIQPLLGVYHQNIIDVLEQNIKKDKLKMIDFLNEIDADIIEMNKIEKENVFTNVNTPEEFENIKKLMS